ncbi:MAG: amidohydrolase family protein [Deltaproteobacteria bacterium]|jgi:uncharacterized protein|nr:amidohydrolase family protein [Deltaproteobacteria bacterium]MBT4643565.1 amidohydrolase family protein [Deltaproteobacteria bacterium]MBT6611068.1 amidohydrolase family protein [Deltaproteobacteria bacterium]MBT7154248.1 amidohydrolase family protein [Deltaproteobacteria bacterium]MBT7710686.1 amidohydrolase family protein [Deltaproteobacteria bacterium]
MGRKNISHIRKPEILEHAYRVVAQEGFVGATITKIAKEMGVNSGILMHYYKNKEELTLALVDYILERTMAKASQAMAQYNAPPEKQLDAMIDIYFDREIMSLTRGSVFWSCYALGFRKPRVMVAIRNMYKTFFKTVIQYLEDAQKADRIQVKDPELMTCILLSMIDGVGYYRMTMGDEGQPKIKQTYQVFKKMIKEMLGLPENGSVSMPYEATNEPTDVAFESVSGSAKSSTEGVSCIIDLRLPLPPSREFMANRLKILFADPKSSGIANYQHIYGQKWAQQLGMSLEELQTDLAGLSEKALDKKLLKLAEPLAVSHEVFLKQLDENGVEWGMIFSEDTEKTAEMVAQYPQRLKGMALIDPHGNNAAEAVECAVRDMGFAAIYASPYHSHIHADDPRYFPVYSKAMELNVPVFIYATMNYNKHVPMEIGHPKYIDRVAMAFPDLQIVASLGGWPWVNEMVGVARRHRNVFIDTSFHRPKHLATPESGWGMLLQFANTLLQDQVLFGSGVGDMGLPLSTIVSEMKALPLKESVMKKWLYDNAARLFE